MPSTDSGTTSGSKEKASAAERVKEASEPEGYFGPHVSLTVVAVGICCAVLAYYAKEIGDALPSGLNVYCQEKSKYGKSFDAFYPFYRSQHQDAATVKTHVLASSIITLIVSHDIRVGISLGIGLASGLFMKELTRSITKGFVEFGFMILMYFWSMLHMKESLVKSALILTVAYGLAWYGHFVYEKNQPATFIYPSYSLMADFKHFFLEVSKFYTESHKM